MSANDRPSEHDEHRMRRQGIVFLSCGVAFLGVGLATKQQPGLRSACALARPMPSRSKLAAVCCCAPLVQALVSGAPRNSKNANTVSVIIISMRVKPCGLLVIAIYHGSV